MTKKNFLLRTGESFLNALPCSLHLSERSTEVQDAFHRKYALSFKYLQKHIAFIFLFMLLSYSAFANNIVVGTVTTTGLNVTDHYTMVQFDLSWENSWRVSSPNYVSAAGATNVTTTITVTSTVGLRVGMLVSVTTGTGVFDAGTTVTAITSATTFTVSAAPTTALTGPSNIVTGYGTYTSDAGATGSTTTITVTNTGGNTGTKGLRVGMLVSVTGGGAFAPGTVVLTIPSLTTFTVSTAPTTALTGSSNIVTGYDAAFWDAAWVFVKYKVSGLGANGNYVSSAGATSSGTTITVSSTTGLRVGMSVSVTGGTGAFPAGTTVTAINVDGIHFTVSAAPSPDLSGGAVVTGYAFWQHATLHSTGHNAPTGSTITPASDGTGAFIYRSADGTGTNNWEGVKLRWNYGADGVADGANVTIKVFGIEMVYVPTGSFSAGSGGSSPEFTLTTINTFIANIAGGYPTGPGTLTPVNATWPNGYNAFYCMKYEIMQQQYVDFLNTLTRTQQATRVATAIPAGTTSVTNRYVMSNTPGLSYRNGIRCDAAIHTSDPVTFYCNLSGTGSGGGSNDGQYIACNFLSWTDLAAYLYWGGLRPMTELEYEKSCRGTLSAISGELAWGSISATKNLGINRDGYYDETSSNSGNCTFGWPNPPLLGPMRVGAFATSSSTRVTSGATYYGIMEMSGNQWERTVTIGNDKGKAFTGTHGNGVLTSTGDADASNWPSTNGDGIGFRGGGCHDDGSGLPVSARPSATPGTPDNSRIGVFGGRGVRSAP
ncbi:MAG: hypothetical protein NTV87_14980 [Ignavibacteriae bacterium]|nr:hypothetical protein [Ignavibacteriota bacterium]